MHIVVAALSVAVHTREVQLSLLFAPMLRCSLDCEAFQTLAAKIRQLEE